MKKFVALITVLILMQACGNDTEDSLTYTKQFVSETPEMCTKDLNAHNNPTHCECLAGFAYDPRLGTCGQEGRLELSTEWSADVDSIQAVLFAGIKKNQLHEIHTPVVSLSDADNLIYCSEDSEKIEDINTFSCTFDLEGPKLSVANDARSVQANLFKILSDYDPKGAAVGQVALKDKKGNRIDCIANSSGSLQVLEYRCSFEFADDIRLD